MYKDWQFFTELPVLLGITPPKRGLNRGFGIELGLACFYQIGRLKEMQLVVFELFEGYIWRQIFLARSAH